MSIVDCFCRGIPVIGPDMAAFHEIIPESLLYRDIHQEQKLAERLISDDEFWIKSMYECRKILEEISPDRIIQKIITVF